MPVQIGTPALPSDLDRGAACGPGTEPAATAWEDAVAEYLVECRRRNLSVLTVEQYEWVLLRCERTRVWRDDHAVHTVGDLNAETLSAFESEMAESGLHPSTVRTFHRRIHSFGRWCQKRYGAGGKVSDVPPPMVPQHFPRVLNDDELSLVRCAAVTERDRMIIEVLLATGVRCSELCALTVDDVNIGPDGTWLLVRQGKGRKDRIVPLDTPHVQLSDRLRRYIAHHRPQSVHRNLFLSQRHITDNPEPFTRHGVISLMRRLSLASGVHVHAHAFRHTFATRAAAAGVSPLVLQRVLGHTSTDMVNVYVSMQPTDILEAWTRRPD